MTKLIFLKQNMQLDLRGSGSAISLAQTMSQNADNEIQNWLVVFGFSPIGALISISVFCLLCDNGTQLFVPNCTLVYVD